MAEDQATTERLRRVARRAGVDGADRLSFEALERRRLQLWGVVLFVLCSMALVAVVASLGETDATRWVKGPSLRFALLALVIGTSVYAIEKEVQLRRLERLLVDERGVATALAQRFEEHAAIAAAGKAVNSALDVGAVLDLILAEALTLLEGTAGSVMLTEGSDVLRVAAVRGSRLARHARVRRGESIAGRVAQTRSPLLLDGAVDDRDYPGHEPRERPLGSAMCVPLLHRGELLGVLNVNGGSSRRFTGDDLQVLLLFAEPVAAAIANARLFADEQAHVAELLELDRLKTELLASVSRELRLRLGAIRGATTTAGSRPGAGVVAVELDDVARQVARLEEMLGDLEQTAERDRPGILPMLRPVDLGAMVRLVALDAQLGGRPVSVDVPEECQVRADPDALRRILGNLIDNAHTHGAPPVVLRVAVDRDSATITVADAGPGVPPGDRERVFERFQRLDMAHDTPGVGLGLAIVRGLVRACGGTVHVDDAAGGGAAFHVRLPVRTDASAEAGSPVEPGPPATPPVRREVTTGGI